MLRIRHFNGRQLFMSPTETIRLLTFMGFESSPNLLETAKLSESDNLSITPGTLLPLKPQDMPSGSRSTLVEAAVDRVGKAKMHAAEIARTDPGKSDLTPQVKGGFGRHRLTLKPRPKTQSALRDELSHFLGSGPGQRGARSGTSKRAVRTAVKSTPARSSGSDSLLKVPDERLKQEIRSIKSESSKDWPLRIKGTLSLSDAKQRLQIGQDIEALFLNGHCFGLENTVIFLGVQEQDGSVERILLGGPPALRAFAEVTSSGTVPVGKAATTSGAELIVVAFPVDKARYDFVLPGAEKHGVARLAMSSRGKSGKYFPTLPTIHETKPSDDGESTAVSTPHLKRFSGPQGAGSPPSRPASLTTPSAFRNHVDHKELPQSTGTSSTSTASTSQSPLSGSALLSPLRSSSTVRMQDNKAPLSVGSGSPPSWKDWQAMADARQMPKVKITNAQGQTFAGEFEAVAMPSEGQEGTSIWVMMPQGARIKSEHRAPVFTDGHQGKDSHLLDLSNFKVVLVEKR
jgi:hypothetical protein